MNFKKKLIPTTLLLISFQTFALNPVEGWYFSFFGGIDYPFKIKDIPTTPPSYSSSVTAELDYKLGGGGGFAFGYRMKSLRLEGELSGSYTAYDDLKLSDGITLPNNNISFKGNTNLIAGLFNIYYDFYRHGHDGETLNTVPFVGLGLGYASVDNKFKFGTSGSSSSLETNNERESVGIYQAILGVNYFFDDFSAIGINYRFQGTGKLNTFNHSYQNNQINLILTFALDKAVNS